DGAHDRLLPLAFRLEIAEAPQGFRRQLRPGPGAEIFRGDVLARDLAQVGVNLFRPDGVLVALLVEVLKQLVTRQVAAAFDDARQPAVVDLGLVAIAALAAEAEVDVATLDPDVPVAQGRQPEALVAPRVLAVADPEQRQVHQSHNGGHHARPRQPRPLQIVLNAGPDERQNTRENQQLTV